MLNILAAIMISAASPASAASAPVSGVQQVASKMIPVLAPRNNGGIIEIVLEWLIETVA